MEPLPELNVAVLTLVLDRETGRVTPNYEGMNYLEAIGVLTVALNQIQDTAFYVESDYDEED